VVGDNADSSPRAGNNNNLEKCRLGASEIAGDGRVRWVVDGDCYLTGKPWYHDQVGMLLHPTIERRGHRVVRRSWIP
jgi:hypothetical protein